MNYVNLLRVICTHDSTIPRPLSKVKHARAWIFLPWGTRFESLGIPPNTQLSNIQHTNNTGNILQKQRTTSTTDAFSEFFWIKIQGARLGLDRNIFPTKKRAYITVQYRKVSIRDLVM